MTQQNGFVVEITKKSVTLNNIFHFFVHVCGVHQRKINFWHFLFFIAFLNSLGQEEYIARIKKKETRLEVRFFALKFIFLSFFQSDNKMLWNVVCFVKWRTFSKRHNKLHFQLRFSYVSKCHQCTLVFPGDFREQRFNPYPRQERIHNHQAITNHCG